MTFTEILTKNANYLIEDGDDVGTLKSIILDILRQLQRQEIDKSLNSQDIWKEICDKGSQEFPVIDLSVLREILEKYVILEKENNGM